MQLFIRETMVKVDYSVGVTWGPTDLQNRIATTSFVYESNLNPAITFRPQVGDNVRLMDDAGQLVFLGHIAYVERGGDAINKRYKISCQDLNYLFDRILLPVDFVYAAGLHDKAIVDDLLFLDASNHWGGAQLIPASVIGLDLGYALGFSKCQGLPAITFKAGTSLTSALNQLSTAVAGVAWSMGQNFGGESYGSLEYRLFHWNDVGGLAPLIFTTSPDAWLGHVPSGSAPFYGYAEFHDRSTHYHRVRADNGGGITATADDWVAFGDQRRAQMLEEYSFLSGNGRILLTANGERILQGAQISDSTLTTQAQVTQRAWQELNKGRIRRTAYLSYDRSLASFGFNEQPLSVGMLVDVVHATWDGADVVPVPTISREVGAHSPIRGELVPGARGRFLIQKITPRLRRPNDGAGVGNVYSYDLVLGDYEDSLAATLAAIV